MSVLAADGNAADVASGAWPVVWELVAIGVLLQAVSKTSSELKIRVD